MPEETTQTEVAGNTQGTVSEPSTGLSESHAGDTGSGADSAGNGAAGNAEKVKKQELSRYERTKRQKAVLAQREAAIRQKEAEFAQRERALSEKAKPKRDYTLEDLQKYRQSWEDEGRFDLVEAADKEIRAMKAEQEAQQKASKRTVDLPVQGTPEHKTQWEAAERELAQVDPEFMREGTRLDSRLREIMQSEDGDVYRQHPRGIVAAYHRAKMELMEVDNKALQTEISKLKEELKRYQGLTSIGGGAPARVGTGGRVESINDFARLSTKEMEKHLKANASRNGVPWF